MAKMLTLYQVIRAATSVDAIDKMVPSGFGQSHRQNRTLVESRTSLAPVPLA